MKLGHCGAESTSVHQQCMPTQMGHTEKRLMQLRMSGGKRGPLERFCFDCESFSAHLLQWLQPWPWICQNVHDGKYMCVHASGCSLGLGAVRTCTCVHAATDLNVHDGKYTRVHAATGLNVHDGKYTCIHAATDLNVHDGKYTCVHAATDLNVHDGKYTCVHAATDLNVHDGKYMCVHAATDLNAST